MDRPQSAGSGGGTLDEVLQHYGIPGMKWGRRKSRGGLSGSSASSHPASSDAIKVKEYKSAVKKGNTDALSTKQLQELVTRMNLEQQYNGLAKKEANKISTGQARVKEIIGVAKTAQEVYSVATSPMMKTLIKTLSK